jgi:hypothetical protein
LQDHLGSYAPFLRRFMCFSWKIMMPVRLHPLYPPEISFFPSGLKTRVFFQFVVPGIVATSLAVLMSQSLRVPSRVPKARVFPSGLNVGDFKLEMPRWMVDRFFPVATFHNLIVVSRLIDASILPFALNVTELIHLDESGSFFVGLALRPASAGVQPIWMAQIVTIIAYGHKRNAPNVLLMLHLFARQARTQIPSQDDY